MEKIKIKVEDLKQFLDRYSTRTKVLAVGGAVVILSAAIIVALILNHKEYTVLFSGVTQEEEAQIVGKLSEAGVEYQYKDNGNILVPEDVADQTRADLAYEGYPKSGFTYDVFTEHAGGMTTDTEKQTYKLYDLQNRIGATIRLFDGVKDAKVTIALEDEQKYVLEDKEDETSAATASAVVTMKDDGSPSEKQALAIQRLVAGSVPGMQMENVSVFDGNGIEISVDSDKAGTSGDAGEQIAQLIETQISKKVINVLGPFFGNNNIRVSARGKINMEKVVRETTTYNTPEKVDEKDKTGIVSNESTDKSTADSGETAGGTAGTEANSDVTEYNADSGTDAGSVVDESTTRDYLVNQIKEQGALDPGVLEDLTVSVAVNSDSRSNISMNQLIDLVGNATGIAAADRKEKITIVNSPFYEPQKAEAKETAMTDISGKVKEYFPIVAVAALLAAVVILITVLLLKRRKKKNPEPEEAEQKQETEDLDEFLIPEETIKPEILHAQNEKSRELRENVREFADTNPEISAQMIRTWLNGGNQDGSNPAK
ncbi:flagellar basal-body MS-ring/collar protein FliF [Clostridium sp. C105KSO13]|uniref:flagellar basal-body MS-ring/collar protein FliF n=1 Tax=Clostridium sp. C105KSO13 TaxID=1776045 RepID=UPI000740738A|nr:flagellar basal-body MS-ring/collar protein FliF [Clostridium sp. C105KSO13]CUX49184.1 Flagellar M-ring protein [Clostridium sp. C105KSO13]